MRPLLLLVLTACGPLSSASEPWAAGRPGFAALRQQPLVPTDLDPELFYDAWKAWPEEERAVAEALPEADRRELVRERYGLPLPPDADDEVPLAYAAGPDGGWATNCFLCHAGNVGGTVLPGAGNAHLDLQSLGEDLVMAKVKTGRPLRAQDLGVTAVPLSGARGLTNAVIFGIVFDYLRDDDMRLTSERKREGSLLHHDVDPPAWWTTKKKSHLYIDGFAPKNHRVLMQFMLAPSNDRDAVLAAEPVFEKLLADIEACEPPAYPGAIDRELAAVGRAAFETQCADCHGTYGTGQGDPNWSYPQRMVPIDEIGTDRARHEALTVADRSSLRTSWMNFHGRDEVVTEPAGYVAPPLDGVWASAPYFHNGAVPTLWHVLHPEDRPVVWSRPLDPEAYDFGRVGLDITPHDRLPTRYDSTVDRRRYYDTSAFGHSSAGHDYPLALDDAERRAVLEYLKTL